MKFDMTTPCPKCPFMADIKPFLRRDRAREIAEALFPQQQTFACHVTVEHDADGEHVMRADEQHCAGAAIVLERMNRPNQMMRIAERCGLYDRRKLAMNAPVFKSLREFIAAQPANRRRTRKDGRA